MTTVPGGDDGLYAAAMSMARQVAKLRANPTSRKAKPLVVVTPGQSNAVPAIYDKSKPPPPAQPLPYDRTKPKPKGVLL